MKEKSNQTGAAIRSEFSVAGMSCNNCVRHVAEAVRSVAGVADVEVRLTEGSATVRWQPGVEPDAGGIVRVVNEAGYEAKPAAIPAGENNHAHHHNSELAAWKFNVWLGMALTSPLMVGEWVFRLGMEEWFHWVGFSFAAPVYFVCGARFFRGAWRQLKRGSSNMDTLVALGSTTAFAYSIWGLLAGWHGHLYFMEAASIITLISAGHLLEAIVSTRAAGSLRALMNLAPQTARKLDADGKETDTPVGTLLKDDLVLLKPGDRVPTDGKVAEGDSAVDESMLTGESVPIDKNTGASLYAGTVNQNGRLVMRVTATGEATSLAQIIAVVQRAQGSRANIQKLGDRVSSVFVPVVVLIAIATGLWWWLGYDNARHVSDSVGRFLWPTVVPVTALSAAIIRMASVLIVACPCAMGLATPAAIMAGTDAAAARGILIRDGNALEKSGKITAVVFDKTGTLTQGRLKVAAVENLGATNENELKKIAAAVAGPSSHPLSRAVARSLEGTHSSGTASRVGGEISNQRMAPKKWQELRGKGIESRLPGVSDGLFRLGSLRWLDECGVEFSPEGKFLNEWSGQGATIIGVASDKQLLGLLALQDELKPHAREVVSSLARQRKTVYLITGDHQLTAVAIARRAGIPQDCVFAGVRPEKKAEIVKQLQQGGERVAFVGDGINDAPALEQADLGIAVGKASDVAREAADIILLKSDIQAIPEALGLAQAALRTIKQNLFWAFFYNAAAVPLAALGFISPVLCAAAMGFSDVIVIGNALRLRRWKPLSSD